jgi:hypothetical protein
MAVGYSLAWQCQLAENRFTQTVYNYCYWDAGRASGLYIGIAITLLGVVIFAGPNVAGRLGKLRSGSDT